jgi:hypothetical protein
MVEVHVTYVHTYCHVAWQIIVGSRSDDWIYWTSLLQLQLIITAHTLNCFLITNFSLHFFWFSDWSLRFYYSMRLTASQLRLTHASVSSQSQSQSHIATDGQSVCQSWCRTPSGAQDQIFITVWQLRYCYCGEPSLTRGRVCLLYMLLVLASAVFLGSESKQERTPH